MLSDKLKKAFFELKRGHTAKLVEIVYIVPNNLKESVAKWECRKGHTWLRPFTYADFNRCQICSVDKLVWELKDHKPLFKKYELDDTISEMADFYYVLRKARGMSQDEFSKLLGCGQARLTKIEKGDLTGNDFLSLIKLATVSGIPVSMLINPIKIKDLLLNVNFDSPPKRKNPLREFSLKDLHVSDYLDLKIYKRAKYIGNTTISFKSIILPIPDNIRFSVIEWQSRCPEKHTFIRDLRFWKELKGCPVCEGISIPKDPDALVFDKFKENELITKPGDIIHLVALTLNINQKKIAKDLGTSQSVVSKLYRRENPEILTGMILSFCEVYQFISLEDFQFGITINELFHRLYGGSFQRAKLPIS